TYRAKSSVRDMAKALGYATGQQDAWSKNLDPWGSIRSGKEERDDRPGSFASAAKSGGNAQPSEIPDQVLELAAEVEHFPRHLGIHSGGMVICDRPVVEVCPVEWARMENRSVLQWDKDDCAAAGLVKFDLLGLGMLSVLHYAVDLIADHHGVAVDLATIPQEDAVYEMLCRADSIGVFQVESRAQMATLPRLKPRCFYDLVVEVALIRPGPIQGGSVHPYIRRRNGLEEVTYLHPLLEGALAKTLGIPLFQEQLMQMSIDVAGFTPAEADQLRQAMGSKRSRERMERIQQRLYTGMAERGITGGTADAIWEKLAAFANYGFPESHSVSFAHLVYASSWIKLHYPAAFCAALLNAQPMGFYSPHSLVQDARLHGVEMKRPDVNRSAATATLEGPPHNPAVRLGIGYVRNIGDDMAECIAAGRPWLSMEELARATGANLSVLESLATAGAFQSLDGNVPRSRAERRRSLWQAGAVAQGGVDRLPGMVTGTMAPQLPGMSDRELALADLWSTGIAPEGHPIRFLRSALEARGVLSAADLTTADSDRRVVVAGIITHRQRPATASGITFLNLEDETGLINVIVSKGCWRRYRTVAKSVPAVEVRGRLERGDGGVMNIIAERFTPLAVDGRVPTRDFR
ncbi:MAG: error-prone DNA polymerase, partial [Actinomycetia bacterium]|nr:error-prone DNA polymerase [Actinomycetes bacterium]